jgi:hypothetical protein
MSGFKRSASRKQLEERARKRAILETVADIARVEKRKHFIGSIERLLHQLDVWLLPRKLPHSQGWDFSALKKAALALRLANDTLKGLFPKDDIVKNNMFILSMHLHMPHDKVPPGIEVHWLPILDGITQAVCAAAGMTPAISGEPGTKRGRGRPKGTRNDWLLSLFLEALALLAKNCGGKLEASRGGGKRYGTLTKALEKLRPLLPPGFARTNAAQIAVDAAARAQLPR